MPDFGQPATPNYTAPDGLATLGNLMSLKQKQQGLVGQQSSNKILASEAVNAEQSAKETQAGASLMSDPVGNGLTDDEGKPTKNAYTIIKQAMPMTGDKHYTDLLTAATGNVEYKNSWLKLRSDVRSDVSSRLAGAAADPNTGLPELQDTIDNLKKDYAGTPASDQVNTIADVSKQAIDKAGQKHGIAGAKQVIMGFSRGGLGNAGITGPGGVAAPSNTSVDTGPTVQPQVVAPALAGGGMTAAGPPIVKNLAPTEKPGYIAERTSASSRATGTASSDIDRSNEVASVQQQSAAAIPLTQRIDQLSHEINSGHLAKMLSEGGNYLGFSSINDARSQLLKDLGQVKGLATAKAGSDSRAATILEGYPTDTTPEATVHAAMDYIRGTARQNLARGSLLSQYQKEDKGLKGFQAADNVLSGKTNPLMHEYLALKPDEQAGFYRRNFSNPQEAQAFKDEVNALKKHTHAFGQ